MHRAIGQNDSNLVLLVEDDPDDANLLCRAFQRARSGLLLEHVEDGEKAVARLASAAEPVPTVVLLDLKLPRVSGFEVLRWMRADPRTRRVPVVVLTSSRLPSDVGLAYDLGANSYLVKPTEPEALGSMMAYVDSYWLSLNEKQAVAE